MKIELNPSTPSNTVEKQRSLVRPGNVIVGHHNTVLVFTEPDDENVFTGLVLECTKPGNTKKVPFFDDGFGIGNFTVWRQFTGNITLTYED